MPDEGASRKRQIQVTPRPFSGVAAGGPARTPIARAARALVRLPPGNRGASAPRSTRGTAAIFNKAPLKHSYRFRFALTSSKSGVVSDDARSILVDAASSLQRQARGRLCTFHANAFRSRKIRTFAILPATPSRQQWRQNCERQCLRSRAFINVTTEQRRADDDCARHRGGRHRHGWCLIV
jgi:hypothetical protein